MKYKFAYQICAIIEDRIKFVNKKTQFAVILDTISTCWQFASMEQMMEQWCRVGYQQALWSTHREKLRSLVAQAADVLAEDMVATLEPKLRQSAELSTF